MFHPMENSMPVQSSFDEPFTLVFAVPYPYAAYN
jgi:hypothetical protein